MKYYLHGIDQTIVLGHTLPCVPTPKSHAQRNGILFVGALRDEGSPNVDSLLWFLINCLPHIEQQIPDLTFYIVGDNNVPSLATVAKDNIVFTGRLDSIDDYYNDCRAFIAPTRFAAGIPHKVHEAASKGLPSVTTTLLSRQLDWSHENQLLSADAADEYAAQCVRLYTDAALWQSIRDAGLKAVEQDCSESQFQNKLAELFNTQTN